MSLTSWIPADWQYGAPTADMAEGAAKRAALALIERHLFADTTPGAPIGARLDAVRLAFANALTEPLSARNDAAVRSLWETLFPPETLRGGAPFLEADAVPDVLTAAFILSMHGLCATFVEPVKDDAPPGPAEEAAEEDQADEIEDEWVTGGPGVAPVHRVERRQVVKALASLLRQWTWRWSPPEGTDPGEARKAVAGALLATLLMALDGIFVEADGGTTQRDGKPHSLRWIELRDAALGERLDRLAAESPFRLTVQPLRRPVAYAFAPPSADDAPGGRFRVDLIGYRRMNAFLRQLHADYPRPECLDPGFERYVAAVNVQQAVAWRVNRPLLAAARAWRERAGPDHDLALALEFLDSRPAKRRGRGKGQKTIPGALSKALEELCPDEGTPPPFFLPWWADYRGRVYAETAWLTPQGGDAQRALLEFARGRPLDAEGVRALRRHGANLARRTRVLNDLGITDSPAPTLAERERWVELHEADILASAAAPLEMAFWREASGDPLQFLAFCLAYRQWREDPSAPIHLPVQIDGTCNGLQHIAALTGDSLLAQAVNVAPGADDRPGDIYSELAAEAATAPPPSATGVHAAGLVLAERWLATGSTLDGWLDRDTAKPVVMTIPYGAGEEAQAHGVLEAIASRLEDAWATIPPDWVAELDACLNWNRDMPETPQRRFVRACGKDLFLARRRKLKAMTEEDELARELAWRDFRRLQTLGAYVALALVKRLRAALKRCYPGVEAFSGWLGKVARACEGLPLLWLTPLGFPVCQPAFKLEKSSLSLSLIGTTVRVSVQRLGDTVVPNKQQSGLLPNLIHSLDATHLCLTLLDAADQGIADIGSVHDCLLCHPNDAATLAERVRRTFAELYAPREGETLPRPLADWRDWMRELAALAPLAGSSLPLLLGALEHPGGVGEAQLAEQAQRDAAARAAWERLAAIRRLPLARQALLRRVLAYRRDHPPPTAKARDFPELPVSRGLDLADGLSPYFFS